MKLRVSVDGWSGDLDLMPNGNPHGFRFASEGVRVEGEASVVCVEPGAYSVLVGGRSYQVRVWLEDNEGRVEIDGRSVPVVIEDPRELGGSGSAAAVSGNYNVTAAMPGRVIRVLVEEGQAVEAGQGILVVEAMKMQNEMQSPSAGTVSSIQVKAGAAVAAGQVLATVEAGEPSGG
ncbi:MAG: biotin/lipoyl-binding protein [Acidimicrobiia bacterium]|nr:biotin/lipoyl-binding protein [Acidimicrobiia bacterium]